MLFNNKINFEKCTSVYLTPFSPESESFKKYLENNFDVNIKGFFDHNQNAKDIFQTCDINNHKFDKIIIISSNHHEAIYQSLIHYGLSRKRIHIVCFNNNFRFITSFELKIKKFLNNILPKIHHYIQNRYKILFEDKHHYLLLSPDFIDINIKALYSYINKQNSKTAIIASNNKQQLQLLKKTGFKVVYYPSLSFIYHSLKAKTKILDHTPLDKSLIYSLIHSLSVQLWHGIPLKRIGKRINYKKTHYDLLVSTSDFVSNYAFSHIFKYQHIINSGYPRNDVLVNEKTDKMTLALVNKSIYKFIQASTLKIILITHKAPPFLGAFHS